MLATLFPQSARQYLSLPLLGPVIDDFERCLLEQGYTSNSRRNKIKILPRADAYLRRRGVRCIGDLAPAAFCDCWKALRRRLPSTAGTVRILERFLRGRGLIRQSPSLVSSPLKLQVQEYSKYLREVTRIFPLHSSQPHSYCDPVSDLFEVRKSPAGTGSHWRQPP